MLTGGYGTVTIGNGKFGIKSKKCLKLGNPDLQSIRGEFVNNNIEVGNTTVFLYILVMCQVPENQTRPEAF